MRLITPQIPSPAPSATTRVCKTSTALLKNAINKSFLPRLRLSGKRTKGGQRMVAAAQKNRPLVKAAVPALRKFCGAAVFSCRGVRLLPLCAAPESRGAYHVADIDICDCFDSSFRCPAVLPDGYYSDLREVNSLHSKVFASRKFTKG